MDKSAIVIHRLLSQRIARAKHELPAEAVAWFGAMQAQEYTAVKWAVGLRCTGATDAAVEQAIAAGSIVRTWLMRGTLHIAAAADVRWMLSLLAPRLIASSARRYRQLELDEATFARSYEALIHALQGGKVLTRAELLPALDSAGISTTGQRVYHILRRAGLEQLICYGPFRKNQESFVLFDEWVPAGREIGGDEALAELARRYFASHGPATLDDFVWWSGLKVAAARTGLNLAKSELRQLESDGQAHWAAADDTVSGDPQPTVYLLPAYDEYYLGYKARDAVLDTTYDKRAVSSSGVFRPMIVLNGQIVGTWKWALKKKSIYITTNLFTVLSDAETRALRTAASEYGAFRGLPVEMPQ